MEGHTSNVSETCPSPARQREKQAQRVGEGVASELSYLHVLMSQNLQGCGRMRMDQKVEQRILTPDGRRDGGCALLSNNTWRCLSSVAFPFAFPTHINFS